MTDGRRHSVDIPISRTLIALRRVKSLRDPSTNSLGKFSALLDNINWETNSSNGISLPFEIGCKEGVDEHNSILGSNSIGLRKDQDDDLGMHSGLDNSKLLTCQNSYGVEDTGVPGRVKQIEGFDNYRSNREEVHGNELLTERDCGDHGDKDLDLACIMAPSNSMEDVDSSKGPIVGSLSMEKLDQSVPERKSRYKSQTNLYEPEGDIGSRVSSPWASVSDALSNRSQSLLTDEEVDVVDSSHRGCGLSYCWSRTPRSRQSNPSDVEDHPLLYPEVSETTLYGRRRHKCINNEISTCSETPRSLSQKFRPNSFDELVGQNVVVRSLLSAISRGMITSFYLFHGPRGTGKTCASRIFAAALNCLSLEEHKPCGVCRECILFFSGRSRDLEEVDSVGINRSDRVRSLVKNAFIPPLSSRFKIFVIDECQLLHVETWATVLNSLDSISHAVFIMITADLDKLPRSAVSRSQKYHFLKIKDADIATKLRKICIEEALNFDQVALDFIASKSNGSLRDAEMMLDQLSLLGKRITMSLAYELIGIVSDEELLDLLDLALSSDTSNTVIRARELMRSKIDPMQLTSQLANLIMDVLAGKCQEGSSEAIKRFLGKHTSEADKLKLSRALKILSETEKQLRMSKHQTTWLTVALLQLSSVESSSLDLNDSKLGLRNAYDEDVDSRNTFSPGESLNHLVVPCSCDDNKSKTFGAEDDFKGTLDTIWKRAIELCQSKSLKSFLRKQGRLYSLHVNQGVAVVELQFHHPNYVSRAEKSWKLIASSLQSILDCNVEIRLLCTPLSKCTKTWKQSFSFFSCSHRMQQKSQSTAECGIDSEYSDHVSQEPIMKDRHVLTCCSDCGPQLSNNCYHRKEIKGVLRSNEGNVLSTGTASSHRIIQDRTLQATGYGINSLEEERKNSEYQVLSPQEPENQPSCFPRSLRLKKKLRSSNTSQMFHTSNQQENKVALSITKKTAFETYICVNDPCVFYGSSTNCSNRFRDDNELKEYSNVLCWRTPTFPLKKAWQLVHQQKRSHLVECVIPCTTAK